MPGTGIRTSFSRKLFIVFDYSFLITLAVVCLIPLIHVFMVSLSSGAAASAGKVVLWPVEFTLKAYEFAASKPQFLTALGVTLKRTVLSVSFSMFITVLAAYPLSKDTSKFKWRTFYVWVFFFTMLFSGGLIPTYLVVKETGLINNIWSLVIPDAVPVFNIILLLNFFRKLPKELEEAAFLDGAGYWQVLFKIYLPISKAALATILLFQMVGVWNEWFNGMIYMNRPDKYPLQSYLRTILSPEAVNLKLDTLEDQLYYKYISDETSKAAQVFVGALPIILTYPFLQKYFTKGITLGSVKE